MFWIILCRTRELQTKQTTSSETSFRFRPLLERYVKIKASKVKRLHVEIRSKSKMYYVHTMFEVDISLLSDIIHYLHDP